MPSFEKTGDWDRASALLSTLGPRLRVALEQAVLQEAHFLRKMILSEFQQGAPVAGFWPPHSPMTEAVRALLGNKKSKLLIQSGDMRASVGVIPIPGGGAFVGVSRSAASNSKLGSVNVALIQEGGATISVHMTPKMRALLFAASAKAGIQRKPAPRVKGASGAGSHVIKIVIPARPFLAPVFDTYAQPAQVEASVLGRIAKLLKGDVGTAGKPRE